MTGDRLRWTRNDRELGRRNGETAVVLSIDASKRMATVAAGEKIATLDLPQERHWEHAYASTVHAAQGRTVDRVLVHLDTKHEKTIGSETFYVAISRARHQAKLYVDDGSRINSLVEQSRLKQYGLEALELAHSTRDGHKAERNV